MAKNKERTRAGSYRQTEADIPKGVARYCIVMNRPTLISGFIAAVVVVLALSMRLWTWIVMVALAFLLVYMTTRIENYPVLRIYEGFLVIYSPDDHSHVAIIKNDDVFSWNMQVLDDHRLIIRAEEAESSNKEPHLVVYEVTTSNYYPAFYFMKKHYGNKVQSYIRKHSVAVEGS
ncbi:hypothetical protein EII22_09855 [Coriobacteriales bacterium OH1046]|nr:hypothetical protein EII22_09855 [Coriobacteriales bacterium OH1046]